MTGCREVQEHLSTYANRDAVSVFQHLSRCGECARLSENTRRLDAAIRALPRLEPPTPWIDSICARVGVGTNAGRVVRRPAFESLQRETAIGSISRPSLSSWLSFAVHAASLGVWFAIGAAADWRELANPAVTHALKIQFYRLGEGDGGGGGGGGSNGTLPSSESEVTSEMRVNRQAAPPKQVPRPTWQVLSDAPALPPVFADSPWSPDADPSSGLDVFGTDRVVGGLLDVSSGSRGGIGGGEGIGVGEGRGWGIGPGQDGGFGGGPYGPGSWDIDPILVRAGPKPPYPELAREKRVEGEVVLRIRVLIDGSTQVLGVLKSLPHCVSSAIESAKQYRWHPALKDGRPVDAEGIVTVRFELLR